MRGRPAGAERLAGREARAETPYRRPGAVVELAA